MKMYTLLPLFLTMLLLVSCSDSTPESANSKKNDHVWKHQVETLEKSKQVSEQLQNNLELQKKQLEKKQ